MGIITWGSGIRVLKLDFGFMVYGL